MAKLLCIDDQLDLRKDMANELRAANHIVFEAKNGREGLEVIRRYRPDLVLCDVDMPEMDGRTLLKEIRRDHSAFAAMPFIFITGLSDRQDIIDGRCLGADDYLIKPVDFDILIATVESRLAQMERLNELKRKELSERDRAFKNARKTIQRISQFDSVTSLPNRYRLEGYLKSALTKAKAEKRKISLFHLELENLSTIAARFGNSTSDDVLRKVGDRLSSTTSAAKEFHSPDGWKSMVASLGGDAFGILLPDVSDDEDLSMFAARIMAVFSEPFSIKNRKIFIGASLGAATSNDSLKTEQNFQQAVRIALQYAKSDGPGAWRPYSPTMNFEFISRAELEQELRIALKKEQFELHYQPIFDLHSGRVISAEALIRWQHPVRGLVSPADFIPAAERIGQIIPMTEWVLKTAFLQAQEWRQAGLLGFQLAINLSPQHLKQPDFLERFTEIASDCDFDLNDLELEITESAIVPEGGVQMEALNKIREAGITLSIDDFGTGYSSLAYLKRLPFDILKIDQTFIRELSSDPKDRATIEAIIKLGHCHGLLIVAEGVETEEQDTQLRNLNCDRLQGYRFSRPLRPPEFLKFMKNYQAGNAGE